MDKVRVREGTHVASKSLRYTTHYYNTLLYTVENLLNVLSDLIILKGLLVPYYNVLVRIDF